MDITWNPSPNFTPRSKVKSQYGQDRSFKEIAIHWWGDPNENPTLQGTVNWLCRANGNSSAHYVVSDKKVFQLVQEEDVSWATGNANPFTISIEIDPNTPGDTYKTVGKLVQEIRARRGNMPLAPHKKYMNTQCPGTIDLVRIDKESMNNTTDTIELDKKTFENLVKKSTQWDETCNYYELGNPIDTLFERLKNYISGIQSTITDCRNKLNESTEKLATTQSELDNRIEQTSRLKEELTKAGQREKDLLNQLEKEESGKAQAIRVVREQLEGMTEKYQNEAKAKGKALNELAEWKSKYENLEKQKSVPVFDIRLLWVEILKLFGGVR